MIGAGIDILQVACRQASGFSPLSLFASGEEGAWYDPSDLSTLFQDAAGTVPVTADGQPVRLMLDKSKGLTLGAERLNDPGFDNAAEWIILPADPSAVIDGVLTFTAAPANVQVRADFEGQRLLAGVTYRLEWTVDAVTAGDVRLATTLATIAVVTTPGTRSYIYTPASTTYLLVRSGTAGANSGVVSSVSVRELPGNHATAPSDAARPLYKTAGGLHWLQFDGVDDCFQTAAISAGANKAQIIAGVRKSAGVGFQALAETGTNGGGGAFSVFAPSSLNQDYDFRISGLARNTANTYAPPTTNIITGLHDRAGATAAAQTVVRVDGAPVSFSGTGVASAANFDNLALNIGSRNAASFRLNGNIYGFFLRFGANLDAASVSGVEGYIAERTGVTI